MIRSCWAASGETWFGPTLTSKRWAHLERSWVLLRADLTAPELPRAHGQNSSTRRGQSCAICRLSWKLLTAWHKP